MSEPYYSDDGVTLHHGDALAVLSSLPDASMDCIVTSPPYLGLRNYGVTGTDWPAVTYPPMHGLPVVDVPAMTCQLGHEPDPLAYIAHLVLIFREARRVLTDDGTLFLNLGDSYAAGSRSSYANTGKAAGRVGASRPPSSLPGKNLLGIPWRAAYALQADGWIIRNDIIWAKSNGMPESVRDRLTAKHEHIFLFAKSPRYYFNLDPIREPHASEPGREGANYMRGQKAMRPVGPNSGAYSEGGRNPGDVWSIATQPFTGAPRSVRPNPDPRGPDAPAYGKERIASADCSQHGSQGLPDSTPSHGGREVAYEIRTSGNSDHPGLVPAGGSESTETNRELSTQPSSSDSPHPPCGPSATPHSTESRRTDPAPSTSQPCTPSAQTTLHTERIEGSLDFDVPATSTHESSNGAPERRGAGARTRPRTPDMCTCSWVDNTPSASHFAVFPPALAEKCILAGCKPGGTVLDPFSGSGTTGMVAARHGHRYVGIDASKDYLDLSLRTRLAQGALLGEDAS